MVGVAGSGAVRGARGRGGSGVCAMVQFDRAGAADSGGGIPGGAVDAVGGGGGVGIGNGGDGEPVGGVDPIDLEFPLFLRQRGVPSGGESGAGVVFPGGGDGNHTLPAVLLVADGMGAAAGCCPLGGGAGGVFCQFTGAVADVPGGVRTAAILLSRSFFWVFGKNRVLRSTSDIAVRPGISPFDV